MREDPDPAIYVYRQAFTDPGGRFRRVWGIIATISLDDRILAHEETMSGPKADRLALMESIPANISPIYALYSEEGGGISAELPSWASEVPVGEFVDAEGTRHTVWAIHDAAFHEKIAAALEPSPLLIADGHHRFATAQNYRDLRRSQDGEGPWGSIMTLLVDAAAQPVCILPYHRIVRHAEATDVLGLLARSFEVERLGHADPVDVERWGLELWSDDRPGVFVAVVGGDAYRLVADHVAPDEIPAGVLKRAALTPLGATSAEHALTFTPDAKEVAAEVSDGRAACGFLIQPVSVERVWQLAQTGATMPEKSTYFHPKPRDGIVIRALEPCGPS